MVVPNDGAFDAVPALLGAFFVVLVAVLVVGFVRSKQRRDAIVAYAVAHGYAYQAADRSLVRRFGVRPFGVGSSRRACDVVSGVRDGVRFTTFRYVYETDNGTVDDHSTETHTWQVTWIDLPSALPTLAFSRDNALLRAMGTFGLRDVDVESHEFNQRWRVVTKDPAFAHAVLAPTVIERMLTPALERRAVFVERDALVSAKQGASDMSDLDVLLDALVAIRDAVPPFVFQDYAIHR